MARQLITVYTSQDREQLASLLNNYFYKNNYSLATINDEVVIKKNNLFSFISAHYIRIYFKENCLLIEGWFTMSGKDYGLDDGIMYSEKHRALSQSIEAIVSLLNSAGMIVENGTRECGETIEYSDEYLFKKPEKK